MERRRFLQAGLGAGAALALPACRQLDHFGIPVVVHQPGMAAGHGLRDSTPLPAPTREIETDVAILGSGIAGLTAAWRLAKEGADDFLLLDGPEPFGNAAGGRFDSPSGALAFPRGAHYLPLPSRESATVREILFEQGIIEAEPFAERPRFSEAALVHADEACRIGRAQHDADARFCKKCGTMLPSIAAPAAATGCWAGACDIARTASQAAAVASSLCTNSCAALCCSAWNDPIGRPNCSRTLR